MAEGFHWAPKRVRLRSRIALGVAVMRIGVGLVVLLGGVALAAMHFRAPPEPAAIEKIVLAHQAGERLSTSSIVTGSSTRPTNDDGRDGSLAGRSIVAGKEEQLTYAADRSGRTDDGRDLTRTLQAELKRVGCYRGAIDGDWGPMSRRAMAEFASRVNASLSVDRPDPLLLRMVQGHQGQACSSAAYVAIRDQPRRENAEPPPGRMSVGGPLVDAGEQGSGRAQSRSRRRPRVANRDLPPPYYRSSQRDRRHWTETIFDDISRR